MIDNGEVSILKIISQRALIKKSELFRILGQANGSFEKSLDILKGKGLIDIVAPLGESSVVVTQKGVRFISESSSG